MAALLTLVSLLAVMAVPASSAPAGHSTSPVFTIPPPEAPPTQVGTSTLVRTDNGVSATLATGGLEPGHVVTLWWVVANAPDDCQAGLGPLSQCGPDDHLAGRGEMSVHHATGRIVDEDGTADFGAHLRVGDLSRGLYEGEPGLLDPRRAEVILVLKTHGAKIPGQVSAQLHTFIGGCEIDEALEDELAQLPPPRPEIFGPTGPNQGCDVIQFSVHRPSG